MMKLSSWKRFEESRRNSSPCRVRLAIGAHNRPCRDDAAFTDGDSGQDHSAGTDPCPAPDDNPPVSAQRGPPVLVRAIVLDGDEHRLKADRYIVAKEDLPGTKEGTSPVDEDAFAELEGIPVEDAMLHDHSPVTDLDRSAAAEKGSAQAGRHKRAGDKGIPPPTSEAFADLTSRVKETTNNAPHGHSRGSTR